MWKTTMCNTLLSDYSTSYGSSFAIINEDSDGQKDGLPVWSIPCTFKFVKDAVIFIQGTQLAPKVIVDLLQIN